MTWEPLDHINADYAINEQGDVLNIPKRKLVTKNTQANGIVTCYIDRKKYRVSRLVAEMFVPNPKAYNYLGYKDGNSENCSASNLVWVSNAKAIDMVSETNQPTKEESKNIRIAINNAIDNDDWELATELGKLLNFGDSDSIRPNPDSYPVLPPETRMPAQLSPVLHVYTDKQDYGYYSTKEVTDVFKIKPSTVYLWYTSEQTRPLKLDIVALVPRTFINAMIDVYQQDSIIDTLTYTNVCKKYNVHLEDLTDLLYTNDNDPITYKGYEFRMSEGQNKIPVDYTKGD